MEPLARAGYVMVAGTMVLALMVGAIGGAFAWAVRGRPVRNSLLWAGSLAVMFFLAMSYFVQHIRLRPAATVGLPLLILALLGSWLTAGLLETHARWRRIWAALVALVCGLLLGFLCMKTGRFDFWAPIPVAIVADLALAATLVRTRIGFERR
jgi:hypothetical protein